MIPMRIDPCAGREIDPGESHEEMDMTGSTQQDLMASILVVDDMQANLDMLSDMLKRWGYRVRPAPNGRLALQAARSLPPDLILLDISMPDMDGFTVCEELKADPQLRDIPVIFLSGHSETLDKVMAFRAGGVDYITKPFQIEEVQSRVETHLKIHRLQKELARHNRDLEARVQAQVKEISDSQLATIFAMSKLAEYRDEETGNHIIRVQRYCRALSEWLYRKGLFSDVIDRTFIENIFHASPLHDIGKVGIPDSILLKPGPISEVEYGIMKQHTVLGARALQTVQEQYPNNAMVRMGMELARSHHEHWDGSGYPDGLTGEAIPVHARILLIADQYDALRNVRPYKPAFDAERTFRILVEGDGRTLPGHFDPRVLEAFRTIAPEFDSIYRELGHVACIDR